MNHSSDLEPVCPPLVKLNSSTVKFRVKISVRQRSFMALTLSDRTVSAHISNSLNTNKKKNLLHSSLRPSGKLRSPNYQVVCFINVRIK